MNYSTVKRRAQLAWYVLDAEYATYDELSLKFGVTRQTIYRDVKELAGRFPIEARSGNGGGVFAYGKYTAELNFEHIEAIYNALEMTRDEHEKLIWSELLDIICMKYFIFKR